MSQFGPGLRMAKYLSKARKTRIVMKMAMVLSALLRPAAGARSLYKKARMLAVAYIRKFSAARSERQAVECHEGK